MPYQLPHPEAKPPTLNPQLVPPEFRKFIPIAEKYGIQDDGYRGVLVQSLDETELTECASFLDAYEMGLDTWLAGPEAAGPQFSDEYVTFTCAGMAADHANVLLGKIRK